MRVGLCSGFLTSWSMEFSTVFSTSTCQIDLVSGFGKENEGREDSPMRWR